MLALSIRQPWAWLISHGYKDVENRAWKTAFRGAFLIHAGWIFDGAGYGHVVQAMGIELPGPDVFERGGIVGAAELVDCVAGWRSPWFIGPYGFVLAHARPVPFIPMPGKPGFFEVEVPVNLLDGKG